MTHTQLPSHRPVWSSRQTAAAFAALGLFWIVVAAAWLATDSVVPWDSKNHFYPMLRYLGGSIAQGEWPLWNPYHFGGHPTVADPQSLLFTPTMLAFAVLSPDASMQAFDLAVLAHLLLAGSAVLLYFRRRDLHPAGAVLAAMMIILGGSASARLQHTGIIISYAFFVPALLLLEIALEKRSWRWGLGFAVTGATMAVGRDQIAFLFTLSLAAYALWLAAQAERPWAWLRSRLPLLLGMAVVAAVLIAVPAVLTLQFLADSNRPGISFGYAAMGSLVPTGIATLFAPDIFGSLDPANVYWGPMWDTVPEGTWTDRSTGYLFAGTASLAVLLWEGLARRRILDRDIRFFVFLAVAATIYALGRYTPVFEVIFDLFPGVKLYRRPADATFVLNVALAFMAGYALSRFVVSGADERATRFSAFGAGLSVLLPLTVVGAALVFSSEMGKFAQAAPAAAGAFVVIAAVFFVLNRPADMRFRFAAAVAVVAITGGELVWRNAASSLNAEPAARYSVYDRLKPAEMAGLAVLKRELAERHAQGRRPRVEIVGLSGAWQNAAMVFGIEDTVGYNALRLADYERLVGVGENAVETNLRKFPGTFRGYRCGLSKLLGLEYLVLGKPMDQLPKHFPRVRSAELLYGADGIYIYRLQQAAPRAYFAVAARRANVEEAVDNDEMPDFDRTREVLLDADDLKTVSLPVSGGEDEAYTQADAWPPRTDVRITEYARNKVSLTVEADRSGILVLHDVYYPGWTATVDGVETPVLRANMLFRGVEVPAGRHLVRFEFKPLSVANLMTAAAGLVAGPDAEDHGAPH